MKVKCINNDGSNVLVYGKIYDVRYSSDRDFYILSNDSLSLPYCTSRFVTINTDVCYVIRCTYNLDARVFHENIITYRNKTSAKRMVNRLNKLAFNLSELNNIIRRLNVCASVFISGNNIYFYIDTLKLR
jgi:hypothetical protein